IHSSPELPVPSYARRWSKFNALRGPYGGSYGGHFSLRIEVNRRLVRSRFNLLQNVHHQVFPETARRRLSLENKPERCSVGLRVRHNANGREIIAQPMWNGLLLVRFVGADARGVP